MHELGKFLQQAINDINNKDLFHKIFAKACDRLKLNDVEVSNALAVDCTIVSHWRFGRSVPRPLMRKLVYRFLLNYMGYLCRARNLTSTQIRDAIFQMEADSYLGSNHQNQIAVYERVLGEKLVDALLSSKGKRCKCDECQDRARKDHCVPYFHGHSNRNKHNRWAWFDRQEPEIEMIISQAIEEDWSCQELATALTEWSRIPGSFNRPYAIVGKYHVLVKQIL